MTKPKRYVAIPGAAPNLDHIPRKASDLCPSLFDAIGVDFRDIEFELWQLWRQGVIRRDPDHPSGFQPAMKRNKP
jgi:hypothetical protein